MSEPDRVMLIVAGTMAVGISLIWLLLAVVTVVPGVVVGLTVGVACGLAGVWVLNATEPERYRRHRRRPSTPST